MWVVVVGRVVGGVPGVVGLLVAVLVNRVLRVPMFTGVMCGLCGRLVIRVRALRVVGIVMRGVLAWVFFMCSTGLMVLRVLLLLGVCVCARWCYWFWYRCVWCCYGRSGCVCCRCWLVTLVGWLVVGVMRVLALGGVVGIAGIGVVVVVDGVGGAVGLCYARRWCVCSCCCCCCCCCYLCCC